MKPSSTKIEKRALNALENVIDESQRMDYQFNNTDREMFWDGYISLFNTDDGEETKPSFEGRVHVQIKGHYDYGEIFIGKSNIKQSVELADLQAFATEKGVLYFHIFTHGLQREIFYSSLYPSKIADYLERAKEKGNEKTISIPFNRLAQNSEVLYRIVKQFYHEATLQGSAYTPLVRDRIRITDLQNVKSINFSVMEANDTIDVLNRLGAGDICLQGKMEGDKYYRPIEWMEGSRFFAGTDIDQDICVGDEQFYSHYSLVVDSEGKEVMRLSPNLAIHKTEGRFDFKLNSSLRELYRDARFLKKVKQNDSFIDGECTYEKVNLNLSDGTEETLNLIIDLYETMDMIRFDLDQPIAYYFALDDSQTIKLVNIRNGAYNSQLSVDISRILWKFNGKFVPLSVIKREQQNELVNEIYSEKMRYVLSDPEGVPDKEYILPLFCYYDVDVLSNLYAYKYGIFRQQIDESDINSQTSPVLLEHVLKMISVFDANGDLHFLELAEYLLQKIEPFLKKEFVLLNRLQMKKRKETLSEADINALNSMDHPDYCIQFGKNVLLENRKAAERCFSEFSEEERTMYKDYPIYKLYSQLTLP